ncbi:superoxide dismutase [Aneurinibacillus sp. Ricciae_BoGa-3]|uniref:superoxide dismutase n=1 Tax=Aneurinibacillus sp. Ricciae_BoGa-3 TaxID=3022697 RepID=UPI002340913B|nr:superoxide dismutase [Aneurinibacillus sp. Ricciae_BoGa-3]WCK55867.1 superoxide dismutase [Aneurinibacillus sp. Ricciae_BoGa-3]
MSVKQHLEQLISWSQDHVAFIKKIQSLRIPPEEAGRLLDNLTQIEQTTQKYLTWADKLTADSEEVRSLYERSHNLFTMLSDLLQENGDALEAVHSVLPVSGQDEGMRGEPAAGAEKVVPIGGHVVPPLPYAYNALEPYIDEQTMRLHHDKHHKSYVDGLNKAEKEMQKARQTGDFSLIKHWENEAAFNGAGHYLHTIFWHNMSPEGGGEPSGAIADEISNTFGGFAAFKAHFSAAAEKVQGSGWAMLVWSPRSHRVEILQAEKHQNESQQDMIPLLVLDVWEHAYYLKYNNRRRDYIDAWWNVVNWNDVNRRFAQAQRVQWVPY